MSQSEEKLDELFLTAFETNHPAMLDWVNVKFELAALRAEIEGRLKKQNERLKRWLYFYEDTIPAEWQRRVKKYLTIRLNNKKEGVE